MAKRAEETRNQMMQNLFGDQSEDEEEEEEEEVDSEHEAAANQSDFHSDEGDGEPEIDGEGEVEGQGEVEPESEAEAQDIEMDQAESEGERIQSSQEQELSDQRMRSDEKDAESEDGYGQRVATSRRREVVHSESEGSEDNRFADRGNEDEADQARMPRSPEEEKENEVVRDVFGDSDEDEPASYGAQKEVEQDSHRSPMEDEGSYEKDMRPEDVVPDEDARYESEDENLEQKVKEKPTGPPMDLEIPLRPPPGQSDTMNMIRVSNIMGIERKPFDPKTYVEEDVFVTDESGAQKRIRLEDNIVRCRAVKNRNGSVSYESNARFVKWSDGSLQLLIGNEVLDISVQEADHDQRHLFLRHGRGILQSQGRLLRNMKFRPSSLSSKSHRLLTAIVDSRHKKIYKVKNCITDIDPEREKEEKEKVEGQNIRANQLLHKKREKVNRKYATPANKGRQLSPGFLEDALEEEEPEDYHSSRRASTRRFEDDLEGELRAEKRIMNAKRAQIHKNIPRKSSVPFGRASRRPVEEHSESEREESEYETDGEDIEGSPSQIREDEHEDEYEDEAEEEEAEDVNSASEEEEVELRKKFKETGGHNLKRKDIELDEESPPRKAPANRRKAVVFDSDEE